MLLLSGNFQGIRIVRIDLEPDFPEIVLKIRTELGYIEKKAEKKRRAKKERLKKTPFRKKERFEKKKKVAEG